LRRCDPLGNSPVTDPHRTRRAHDQHRQHRQEGERPETIKRLLYTDAEALAAFEAAIVGKHGGDRGDSKSDNITLERGTSKAYTLRRLAKDAPELFEEVKAGRLSAHAAADGAARRYVIPCRGA
jgi:hypothetical protein